MPSKSSRHSNKRCDNLGLGTPHRKIQEGEDPTHRTKKKKIWIISGQAVQATSKEGHQKGKERYQEVVRLLLKAFIGG
jgi:hypothetical protein